MKSGQEVTGRLSRSNWQLLLAIVAAVLGFYLFTMAPTVLWGDDAYFQRTAATGALQADGGGHWLWLQLAKLFVSFPFGDVAYRVNLLSGLAGALTILVVAAAALELGVGPMAAAATGLGLAVSHTFWTYAVRAEVYAVFTLMAAVQLLLWFAWKPQRPAPILIAALLFGATLLAHQMALLLLPAAIFLLWWQRSWLNRTQWILLAVMFGSGMLAAAIIIFGQVGSYNIADVFRLYFTQAGIGFGQAMFDFSLSYAARDAAVWVGLLGLQFIGLAGLLGLWGILQLFGRTWTPGELNRWISLIILYITSVFFAFSYRINDQFVFYLPSYIAFCFFIGLGWKHLLTKRGLPLQAAIMAAIVVLPILTYISLPKVMEIANASVPGARILPGREPNRFFLWPSKRSYSGAADYGQESLSKLPGNSYLLADHTPFEALRYLQEIEGVRPDVCLVKITAAGEDLAPYLQRIPADAVVFLADNNPNYYNLTRINYAELQQQGVVYELVGARTAPMDSALCQ